LDHVQGPRGHRTWSRRNEEFAADFCLIAKRALSPEMHRVFEHRFLKQMDWKEAVDALGIDKGNFFHMVYDIQEILGRAFRETEPHSLYPVDEYFSSIPAKSRVAEPVLAKSSLRELLRRNDKVARRFPTRQAPLRDLPKAA
jgi:hypothetical protein